MNYELEEAREHYFQAGGAESDIGPRTDPVWYWRRAAKLWRARAELASLTPIELRPRLSPADIAEIMFSTASEAARRLVKVIEKSGYIAPESGDQWSELFQRASEQLETIVVTLRIRDVFADRVRDLEAQIVRLRARLAAIKEAVDAVQ